MKKNTESKQEYECEICGASSDEPKDCCGQAMKKDDKNTSQSKDKGFYVEAGKYSRGDIKKKSKSAEVTRFINEGNPNIQEDKQQTQGKNDQSFQEPEQKEDRS